MSWTPNIHARHLALLAPTNWAAILPLSPRVAPQTTVISVRPRTQTRFGATLVRRERQAWAHKVAQANAW